MKNDVLDKVDLKVLAKVVADPWLKHPSHWHRGTDLARAGYLTSTMETYSYRADGSGGGSVQVRQYFRLTDKGRAALKAVEEKA